MDLRLLHWIPGPAKAVPHDVSGKSGKPFTKNISVYAYVLRRAFVVALVLHKGPYCRLLWFHSSCRWMQDSFDKLKEGSFKMSDSFLAPAPLQIRTRNSWRVFFELAASFVFMAFPLTHRQVLEPASLTSLTWRDFTSTGRSRNQSPSTVWQRIIQNDSNCANDKTF